MSDYPPASRFHDGGADAATTGGDDARRGPIMSSRGYAGLASGLCLALTAGALPPSASAQSARPAELTGALLGLQSEFPASLHRITPELLALQAQLVKELEIRLAGVRNEARTGQ